MRLTFDCNPYFFLGFGYTPSHCRIRIFEDLDSADYKGNNRTTVVVVATDLREHPENGTSIVNAAEQIATEIYRLQLERQRIRGQHWLPIDTFVWYQHVPTLPDVGFEEEFKEVHFDLDKRDRFFNPRWQVVPKSRIESHLRQRLS